MADWMETRRNAILQLLLNALCLWDLQWLWAFRRWRDANGDSLRAWLQIIARMEVLSSLANVAGENPDWVFPDIGTSPAKAGGPAEPGAVPAPLIEAQSMGHPLLDPGVRVSNDLRLRGPGETFSSPDPTCRARAP